MRTTALLLLALLSLPASAAELLAPGPERAASEPILGPAAGDQYWAWTAAGAEGFLVAWNGRTGWYGNRLDRDGHRLDAAGIPLDLEVLRTVGVEGGYLIVGVERGQIATALLPVEGRLRTSHVLGPLATSPGGNEAFIAAVSIGSRVLVVMQEQSFGRLRGRILDAEGRPLGDWLELGTLESDYRMFAAAGHPGGFAVFLAKYVEGGRALFARSIALDGALSEWVQLPADSPGQVAAGFDGENYLVTWSAETEGNPRVEGRFFTTALRPASEPFTILAGATFPRHVFRRPGGSLVSTGYVPVLIAVGTAANPTVGPALMLDDQHIDTINPVPHGDRAIYLETLRAGDNDLAATVLDLGSLAEIATTIVTLGARDEDRPAVAAGSSVNAIAWQELDKTTGHWHVVAARIRPDGSPLDDPPVVLSEADGDAVSPAIAFDGTSFLVVWSEPEEEPAGTLKGRHLPQSGLPRETFTISPERGDSPALAWDGSLFLAVWEGIGTRQSTHGPGREIFGARIRPDGFVLDPTPLLISSDPWDHYRPDVTGSREGFLVSWQTYFWYGHHSPVNNGASVALVSRSGVVGERTELAPLTNRSASSPKLAWNGSELLAAWNGGTTRAMRLSAEGVPIDRDPFGELGVRLPIACASDVAPLSGGWLLTCGTRNDVTTLQTAPELHPLLHQVAAGSSDSEEQPVLATREGEALLVYRRIDSSYPFNGAGRIRYRFLEGLSRSRPVVAPDGRRSRPVGRPE